MATNKNDIIKRANDQKIQQVDQQLAQPNQAAALWRKFAKSPRSTPVYTIQQLSKLISTQAPANIDKSKIITTYFKANPSVLSIAKRDQALCKMINNQYWSAVDPTQRWWYRLFNWLFGSSHKKTLTAISPIFKASLERKRLYTIFTEDKDYFNSFIYDQKDDPRNIALFTQLIKNLNPTEIAVLKTHGHRRLKEYLSVRYPSKSQLKPSPVKRENESGEPFLESRLIPQEPNVGRQPVNQNPEVQEQPVNRGPDVQEQPVNQEPQVQEQPVNHGPVVQPQRHQDEQGPHEPNAQVPPAEQNKVIYPADVSFVAQFPFSGKQSLSKHAKETSVARNNNPLHQFKRDVEMMAQTLANPGLVHPEIPMIDGPRSKVLLQKLLFTLDHVGASYKRDRKWHRFSNSQIPLGAILAHTGRFLLQLPPSFKGTDYTRQFIEGFLGINNTLRRGAATHGVVLNPYPEDIGDGLAKHIVEVKPGLLEAGWNAAYDYLYDKVCGLEFGGHYGINLAFGGEGNPHFLSQKMINNLGQNGHLYIYVLPATEFSPGGLLFGIEQSAPTDCADPSVVGKWHSVEDNIGGAHTPLGGSNPFSIAGGDPWGQNPVKTQLNNPDYVGITQLGPDEYYDALFGNVSIELCEWIQNNFDSELFNPTCLARPTTSQLATLGCEQMTTLYREMKPSSAASWFWNVYQPFANTVAHDDADIADLDTTDWYHLDVGRGLAGASTIDKGYRQRVIDQACDILAVYVKEGNSQENKQVLRKHIDKLHDLKSWQDLLDAILAIENINVQCEDEESPSSIAKRVIVKPNARILGRSDDSSDKESDVMLKTILPAQGWYGAMWPAKGAPRTFEQLTLAHQKLMGLFPQKGRIIDPHIAKNNEEILEWRGKLCKIDPKSEFKCVRDFLRDIAINGVTGEQRKPADMHSSLTGDDLLSIEERIIKDVRQLCAHKDNYAQMVRFILASGGQDMTRFAEELIFKHLRVEGHPDKQFRIFKSESCGNWTVDDKGKVIFDLKIYSTSLVQVPMPAQGGLFTLDPDSGQLVESEPNEDIITKQQEYLLPKLLQASAKISLEPGPDGMVRPAIQHCEFEFFCESLDMNVGRKMVTVAPEVQGKHHPYKNDGSRIEFKY